MDTPQSLEDEQVLIVEWPPSDEPVLVLERSLLYERQTSGGEGDAGVDIDLHCNDELA